MNTTSFAALRGLLAVWIAAACAFSSQAQHVSWFDVGEGLAADVAEDVKVSPDGNVYVTGRFMVDINLGDTTLTAAGGNDVFIAKYDSAGTLIWAKAEGGDSDDFAIEIAIDSMQNVYVAGRFIDTTVFSGNGFRSKGSADIFVVKYDTDGNYQWLKVFGGNKDDRCRGLAADAAGNVYLGGRYRNALKFTTTVTIYGQGADDAYVAKLNTNGDFQWVRSLGSSKADFGEAIDVDPFGNVISTGSFFDTLLVMQFAGLDSISVDTSLIASGDEEGWLAKWDPDGNLLWAQLVGGTERDYGEDISTDAMGNIYLGGAFSGTGYFGDKSAVSLGGLDFFIAKYDPDGRCIWARGGGSPTNNDVVWGTSVDGKGNIFLTGWYRGNLNFGGFFVPANESYNWFVAKLDANGKPIWVEKIGHPISTDIGRGISCDGDGNPYTVGSFDDTLYLLQDTLITDTLISTGASDALIIKKGGGEDRCAFGDAVFNPGPCDPLENTYDLEVTVTYFFEPDSGELFINGVTFPITGSPQTVIVEDIQADDSLVDVLIRFTDQTFCNFPIENAYKAPAPCGTCTIVDVSVDSVSPCKPSTNTYFVKVTADYAQEPDSGLLIINDREFSPSSDPLSVTLFNFWADGSPVDLDAYFSTDTSCSFTQAAAWTSPPACSSCQIVGAVIDSIGACDPIDNSYSATLTVGYIAVQPGSLLDVNGQLFEPAGNPTTITLSGLPSDGAPFDLSIRTTADTSCALNLVSAWTAPAACDTCYIDLVTLDSITSCDPLSVSYDAWVEVTYSNAPGSGLLDVNGVQVPITGSPQIVALNGLASDGQAVDVTVSFTADTGCTYTQIAVFDAPIPCDTCTILSVVADSIGACNPATDTYSAYLSVEFLYPPDSGVLTVNGVDVPVGSSPLSVVLDGLIADGAAVPVTASFSEDPSCTWSDPAGFISPEACDTCPRPTGLKTEFNVLVPGKVLLSWDAIPEAVSYLVQGKRITANNPATVIASSNAKLVGGIKPNKTYVWWAFSVCADDTSAMSAIDTFTSPAARAVSGGDIRLDAFPNPASDQVSIVYETQDPSADNQGFGERALEIRVTDLAGRLLSSRRETAFEGYNVFALDIRGLEQGVYLIQVDDGIEPRILNLIVGE